MSSPSFRERIDERMRLIQIYEVFLRYGSDAVFDRGVAGNVRRALQGWFWSEHVEALTMPQRARLISRSLGPRT